MPARTLIDALALADIVVTADAGQLFVRPVSQLTDDQRAAIVANKPELITLIATDGMPSVYWKVTDSAGTALVTIIPPVTASELRRWYPGASVEPLTAEQWAAFAEPQPAAVEPHP